MYKVRLVARESYATLVFGLPVLTVNLRQTGFSAAGHRTREILRTAAELSCIALVKDLQERANLYDFDSLILPNIKQVAIF